MRCEDFPACGHYERSTGDIFCNEANMSREDRELRDMEQRHDEERRRLERRRELEARPIDCHEAYALAPTTAAEAHYWLTNNRDTLRVFRAAVEELEWGQYGKKRSLNVLELRDVAKQYNIEYDLECHEDDEETKFRACRQCVSEWESEAENYRDYEREFA